MEERVFAITDPRFMDIMASARQFWLLRRREYVNAVRTDTRQIIRIVEAGVLTEPGEHAQHMEERAAKTNDLWVRGLTRLAQDDDHAVRDAYLLFQEVCRIHWLGPAP